MKKQYISPLCVSIEIDPQDIIAESPGMGSGYSDPDILGLGKDRFDDFDLFEDDEIIFED
ncbi:MAG: hypothetical protein MJZ36_06310 [Bacteroidaceae bacterium]|nr:hypothetical protein [Bacteroidaceae bacterium]